jgi:hypothetical protein
MKKFIGCMVALFVTASSFAAFAQEDELIINDKAGPSRVYGGFGLGHVALKKITSNSFFGLLGYKYCDREDFYIDVKGGWGAGKFDGKMKFEGENRASHVKGFAHPFDLVGRFGWMFGFGQEDEFGVAPFIGVGYFNNKSTFKYPGTAAVAYLNDFYGKTKTHGYTVPFGVALDWKVVPEFTVGLTAQIDWLFSGKAETEGSVCALESGSTTSYEWPAVTKETVKLKKKFNMSFELPMTYQLTSEWDVSLVPHFSKSDIEPKATTCHKPKTTAYGARLEVGYSF